MIFYFILILFLVFISAFILPRKINISPHRIDQIIISLLVIISIVGILLLLVILIVPILGWGLWYYLRRKWERSERKISYKEKTKNFVLVFTILLILLFLGEYILGTITSRQVIFTNAEIGYETMDLTIVAIPFNLFSSFICTLIAAVSPGDFFLDKIMDFSPFLAAMISMITLVLKLVVIWGFFIALIEWSLDYIKERNKTFFKIAKLFLYLLIIYTIFMGYLSIIFAT